MNLVASSLQSLRQMFLDKTDEFINLTDNVHMLWLEEIQQEAMRMFSRDFNAEPELMPKTPSQKKNSRRKRVSVGRQEEGQVRRRLSKGRRSNLRGSAVTPLNLIAEEEPVPEASTSAARPKRATRANKQTKSEAQEVKEQDQTPQLPEGNKTSEDDEAPHDADMEVESAPSSAQSPPKIPSPGVVVRISSSERLSAEHAVQPEASSDGAVDGAAAAAAKPSQRSAVRCSLKLRHSLAGLRPSMTRESVRRASRRSILKRRVSRMTNSMCSNNDEGCSSPVEEDCSDGISEAAEPADAVDDAAAAAAAATVQELPKATPQLRTEAIQEAIQSIGRVTRSVAANSPKLAPPSLFAIDKTPNRKMVVAEKQQSARKSRRSTKRKAPEMVEGSPTRRFSPPKKSHSAIRPNMRSFLHTVQKNQMLMMTPNTLGRTGVIKSFIKHTTPLKLDPKTKERNKLEALKKKLEQEEERMKKMEEEKKKKQEELRRKREERLKRVNQAKVKEEQKEEQKKKKIEQKMAQIDEKNDKRLADEKAKKAAKRQEELEQKKKLEEEARKKKEEEKRQQELLAKMKAEEEEQQRLAEARRAQQERERLAAAAAAAERERLEREKALALKMEVERAAREKERKEQEQKRRALEERRRLEEQQRLAAEERAAQEREAARQREAAAKQGSVLSTPVGKGAGLNVTIDIEGSVLSTPVGKGAGLNVTVDIEKSPQSYKITPKGGNKPVVVHSTDNYGMDQNSDDSTDDESAPRKPIPSWAQGAKLQQVIMRQYFNPPDLDAFFGPIETPRLEKIFFKSKPRFFKRTSSAVWHEPMQ